VLRFHRTEYGLPDGRRFRTSWWQLGDRIWHQRVRPAA
jgi:hypothetical protein